MDIKQNQLQSPAQQKILRTMASSVARPGCKFLEVGSWCGDSTLILGHVARNNHGHLFCVDWWKGNPGTELARISEQVDIFTHFWNRIREAGLTEVVIPIRTTSAIAADILKPHSFDLVFLDADHRYDAVLNDLQRYPALVKDQGILLGHDCEGYRDDFEAAFLLAGRDMDYYQAVHCGVVLAVGETFKDYSLHHGIWSVLADKTHPDGFRPTEMRFNDLVPRRQTPPPPIGVCGPYHLYRYGKRLYAVPHSIPGPDLTEKSIRMDSRVVAADTPGELAQQIGAELFMSLCPTLYETHNHFHLLASDARLVALREHEGRLEIKTDTAMSFNHEIKHYTLKTRPSLEEVTHMVDLHIIGENQEIEYLNQEIQKRDALLSDQEATLTALQKDQEAAFSELFSSRIEALTAVIEEQKNTIRALDQQVADAHHQIKETSDQLERLRRKVLDQEARLHLQRYKEHSA